MTPAAARTRHLALLRLERAAGQAFGCPEEASPATAPRRAALAPALAGLAVAAILAAAAAAVLALPA